MSRVGQSFIKCMDHRLTVEDCWEMVHGLVKTGVDACNDPAIEDAFKVCFFINNFEFFFFKLPEQPPIHFDRLCSRLPCYPELKLFVKQIADEIFDNINTNSLRSSKSICKGLLKTIDDNANRLKCKYSKFKELNTFKTFFRFDRPNVWFVDCGCHQNKACDQENSSQAYFPR